MAKQQPFNIKCSFCGKIIKPSYDRPVYKCPKCKVSINVWAKTIKLPYWNL